jgi:hypothetical protein
MNNKISGGVWLAALAATAGLVYAPASMGHEVVAGWEGSAERGYAFVAPALTLHQGDPFSWILRGSLSYLYYDFPEAGGDTEVRSPGQSLGFALRYAAPSFTVTVGPGYEVRQTRRKPAAGAESEDNENGSTVEGNVFIQATPRTVVSLLASYGDANEYYWARGGIKQQVGGSAGSDAIAWHLGAELTSQGNEDVDTRQLGGVLEAAFARAQASLQLRAGYSRQENPDSSRHSDPYFGVGLYHAF